MSSLSKTTLTRDNSKLCKAIPITFSVSSRLNPLKVDGGKGGHEKLIKTLAPTRDTEYLFVAYHT